MNPINALHVPAPAPAPTDDHGATAVVRERRLTAHPQPSPMPADEVTAQIDALLGQRHAVVFIGFSGLGYEHPGHVCARARQVLDAALRDHGQEGVAMIIGGTTEGIGMLYEVVANDPLYREVLCVGVVSEQVRRECPQSLSPACADALVVVPDPGGTWEVRDATGAYSYTPYPAQSGRGEVWVFGGGQVAAAEVECAHGQGVDVQLVDARPQPELLAGKLRQGKTPQQLMPINSRYFTAAQGPA
ncbi:hypothetical protein [Pseudomonas sp. MWU13-3659]|uniref:hypothetical protein n=1 Tax=Pseudomonas sp. MWU13-3659 TaxID=2986964 RepID=UPI002075E782|nr:hypothetical protein [Pseudomonas sp. MWU13-3659]